MFSIKKMFSSKDRQEPKKRDYKDKFNQLPQEEKEFFFLRFNEQFNEINELVCFNSKHGYTYLSSTTDRTKMWDSFLIFVDRFSGYEYLNEMDEFIKQEKHKKQELAKKLNSMNY